MDYKKLLDKYWAGETTIEEEKTLKQYFKGEEVRSDLLPYKNLFVYWKKESEHTLTNFDVARQTGGSGLKISGLRLGYKRMRMLAAAIACLIAFGFALQYYTQSTKPRDLDAYWAAKEIKDPNIAYAKARAALLLVSSKLNAGTETAINQVHKVKQVRQFIKSPD